jgi:hypothetical protein
MGPIYQQSQGDEMIPVEYLEKLIREKKMLPSNSSVGSPILFVPKPNGERLWLCVDYRQLNDHTKMYKTPLPLMDELSRKMQDCTHTMKIDMRAGFHLTQIAMGHEQFTAFLVGTGFGPMAFVAYGGLQPPSV